MPWLNVSGVKDWSCCCCEDEVLGPIFSVFLKQDQTGFKGSSQANVEYRGNKRIWVDCLQENICYSEQSVIKKDTAICMDIY